MFCFGLEAFVYIDLIAGFAVLVFCELRLIVLISCFFVLDFMVGVWFRLIT